MLRRRIDDARYFARAELAADDILALCFGVQKAAPKILDRKGFSAAVRRMIARLAEVTAGSDAAAIRIAAKKLDRRWGSMSEAERNKVIRAAAKGIADVPTVVAPKVVAELRGELPGLVAAAKKATAEKHSLAIAGSLNEQDARIVDFAARSQGAYITDQYGQRAVAYEQRARDIVSKGLDAGLGREDISERLSVGLSDAMLGRARSYWDTVASIHVARARSYGQMSGYGEADIERYQVSAAGDEATCVVCYYFDGRDFSVSSALDGYRETEESDDPYAVEDAQPFVNVGRTDDGERFLYARSGGKTHVIATVIEDVSGQRDAKGSYGRSASASKIEEIGCQAPPYHGRCRCLTVPA
jgi:hypothetical protein